MVLPKGPKGVKTFNFTYQNRENPDLILDLGEALCEVSSRVQGGIQVFFTADFMLSRYHSLWKVKGIIQRIRDTGKRVFIETSSELEAVFEAQVEDYRQEIERMAEEGEGKTSGAVFLAVAGGMLSQGSNLTD